jgi:predicted NBD/HSP70 family sugar kinase
MTTVVGDSGERARPSRARPTADRSDLPVEHLHVRRHNLSLVLRLLGTRGPRSRAGIAAVTGLTRATVSSLAAELADLGLVRDLGPDAGHRRGRPATLLELDGSHVVTIGIELNVGFISIYVRDLGGREVLQRRISQSASGAADPALLVDVLRREIGTTMQLIGEQDRHVSGLTVAVPGVVDIDRGLVRFAPNLGWRDVRLLDAIRDVVGPRVALWLDNEANLGALAEFRAGSQAGTPNLIYVLVENGVGGGLIVDRSLQRGASGAAGEIGHMTIQPVDGRLCGCGSRGCWETLVGLPALLRATVPDVADEILADRELASEARTAVVVERAKDGDPVVLAALEAWAEWVGVGLANLIDLFDPDAIVLAGHLCALAPFTLQRVIETAAANSLPGSLRSCRIEVSSLGFSAAALGGAIHAAERIFTDPTLIAA